jgi:hypothetical protein
VDEIKQVFKTVFTRDVRSIEPTKTGLIVGDSLRVYKEGAGFVLSFLSGTGHDSRRGFTEKLDQHNVNYKVGEDFTL